MVPFYFFIFRYCRCDSCIPYSQGTESENLTFGFVSLYFSNTPDASDTLSLGLNVALLVGRLTQTECELDYVEDFNGH